MKQKIFLRLSFAMIVLASCGNDTATTPPGNDTTIDSAANGTERSAVADSAARSVFALRQACKDCSTACVDKYMLIHRLTGAAQFEAIVDREDPADENSAILAPKVYAIKCLRDVLTPDIVNHCSDYIFVCSAGEENTNTDIVLRLQSLTKMRIMDVSASYSVRVLMGIVARNPDSVYFYKGTIENRKVILVKFRSKAGTPEDYYLDLSGDFPPDLTITEIACP